MKTTIVQSTELGDDWRPSAHMPRVLTAASNVQQGDRIRVRDHRGKLPGEGEPRWHLVTVTDLETDRATVLMGTDKWPIAYVCTSDELVELVEIKRRVKFRCVTCHRSDQQDTRELTVTLKDFIDPELMRSGELHVMILPDTQTREQTGYCHEHGTTFLS